MLPLVLLVFYVLVLWDLSLELGFIKYELVLSWGLSSYLCRTLGSISKEIVEGVVEGCHDAGDKRGDGVDDSSPPSPPSSLPS